MSLHALPAQVLISIATQLQSEFDSRRILPLVLSCRRFQATLTVLMKERVSVVYGSKRYGLLLRTLHNNSEYGKDVRSLSFSGSNPYNSSSMASFLGSFPALLSVHIVHINREFISNNISWIHHCISFLMSERFPSRDLIRNLSVQAPELRLDTSALLEFMSLPRLESLMVCAKDEGDTNSGRRLPLPFYPPSTSNIKHLDLSRPRYVNSWITDIEGLEDLVKRCPRLESLACNIPGQNQTTHRPIFSARQLNNTLAALTERLTILHLRTGRQNFSLSDEGYLDLSAFVVMKELCISAICFFLNRQPLPKPYGLSAFLPSSLEMLEVRRVAYAY